MEEKIKPWINLYLDDKHNLKTKLEYIQKEKNINRVCKKLHVKENSRINQYIDYMKRNNIYCIPITSKEYPEKLKMLKYPPIMLYAKGNINILLENRMIGVIGSRECTNYGKEIAIKIGKFLAKNNIHVVSGLAIGIDSYSHIGCIKENSINKNSGKTIAVIGNGLDNIYPYQNQNIAEEIIKNNGCIISEYIVGTKPLKENFPARNRIISGLSNKLIVVEAKSQKSGTMITVDFSLNLGKDVLVVPGNINSKYSSGTNMLIKEGAKIVTSLEDILEDDY